ncbi:MAG: HlyD family type I secretion periplasmic adaptor subunit [Cellvibrionaceae bacterium]
MKTLVIDELNVEIVSQWKLAITGFLAAFFMIMLWGYFAPLTSAVVAPGTLKTDGHRYVIQHPQSAITERIHVNDGDAVKAGDLLIELDSNDLKASELSLKIEYLQIKLEKNRHYANLNEDEELTIPSDLLALAKEIDQAHRPALEFSVWKEERRSRERKVELLNTQERSLKDDLAKEITLRNHWKSQIALLGEDQSALSKLNEQSMVSRSQKAKVDHAMIDLRKNHEISRHKIVELKNNIVQIPSQIGDVFAKTRKEALTRYQALDRQEPKVIRQLAIIQKDLLRRRLVAPIDGRVNGLSVSAAGGTIQANTPLLEIVPDTGDLVVEARISTRDIDSLTGLEEAKVRLTALNPRHHQPLSAKIQSISADIVHDNEGNPFYRMELSLLNNRNTQLYPGMSTEVFINTGDFSVFDSLIGRLIQTSENALRETL